MKKRIVSLLLNICILMTMIPLSAITAFASSNESKPKVDAMKAIENSLASYMQGETQSYTDDGYIGIPYKVTVFYDSTNGATVPNVYSGGTPVIMYVVNSCAERTGTDSDVSIITSMLDSGYVVVVLDYLNNPKAVSPELEWSAQSLRAKMMAGDYFTDNTLFPKGQY